MKKHIMLLLVLTLALAACKNATKSASNDNEQPEEGVYSAIFMDIQGTNIDASIDPNVYKEIRKLKNINLTDRDQFWGERQNYFMHAIGALVIPESGAYVFRLTSAGKIKLQLNNVDLVVANDLHEKSSAMGKRVLQAGISVFDFEYYDGNYDPWLVLEWSRDGINFEIIPDDSFVSIDRARVTPFELASTEATGVPINTLSKEEIADGWQLLFDGATLNGWHTYNHPGKIGGKWQVQDGLLYFEGYDCFYYTLDGVRFDKNGPDAQTKLELGGGDIVTDAAFENFELSLEWKISDDGNSGIFYTVQEIPEYTEPWNSSPEMQVMDLQGQKDGLIKGHRVGDLYDLIASNEIRGGPQGSWNLVKIVKNQGKVEHWLNGAMVLSYDMNSDDWNTMIANSKFAVYAENFAQPGPGKIGLQDHNDPVWFRNIKIKSLN